MSVLAADESNATKDFEIRVNEQDMALIRRALGLLKRVEQDWIDGTALDTTHINEPNDACKCRELLTKLERQA